LTAHEYRGDGGPLVPRLRDNRGRPPFPGLLRAASTVGSVLKLGSNNGNSARISQRAIEPGFRFQLASAAADHAPDLVRAGPLLREPYHGRARFTGGCVATMRLRELGEFLDTKYAGRSPRRVRIFGAVLCG
jgi:hypothetical protein